MAGFDFSKSESQSTSSGLGFGASQGTSFVSGAQAPFLDFLRNSSVGLFGQQQQGLQQFGQQSQDLFQQGQQLIGGLTQNPFLSSLQAQAGGNPDLVAQQTGQLGEDLGRFFNEQLAPGIGAIGQQAGQFGQSRGNIGRGIAAQGVTEQFRRGATDFQAADAARSQQAAVSGAQFFGQGSQAGIQGLGQLQGLLESPFGQQLNSLMALIQGIGDPTVLNQQSAFDFNQRESQSTSSSIGGGISGI